MSRKIKLNIHLSLKIIKNLTLFIQLSFNDICLGSKNHVRIIKKVVVPARLASSWVWNIVFNRRLALFAFCRQADLVEWFWTTLATMVNFSWNNLPARLFHTLGKSSINTPKWFKLFVLYICFIQLCYSFNTAVKCINKHLLGKKPLN